MQPKDLTHLVHKENTPSDIYLWDKKKILNAFCSLGALIDNIFFPMGEILTLCSPHKLSKNLDALSEYGKCSRSSTPKKFEILTLYPGCNGMVPLNISWTLLREWAHSLMWRRRLIPSLTWLGGNPERVVRPAEWGLRVHDENPVGRQPVHLLNSTVCVKSIRKSVCVSEAVFQVGIRICRIRMFLDLLDPHQDT